MSSRRSVKPMLAGKVSDLSTLSYPLLASVKLDGIRALIVGGMVLSRKLEPIPNEWVQQQFGKKKYEGLDGELIVGDANNEYRAATSGIMRSKGRIDVTFHAFDDFSNPHDPFHKRYARLVDRVEAANAPIDLVAQHEVNNEQHVLALEQPALEDGYEGLMLRRPDAPYKFGRSTEREGYLLKLKRFEDGEAVIVGFEELEHNLNEATTSKVGSVKRSTAKSGRVGGGVLGALVVMDVGSRVTFNIGSGFDENERRLIWASRKNLLGGVVKYQYFPTGSKTKPRFPTFKGFRDLRDMS